MTEPEAITSTPDVLLDCLVYWNAVFSVSVLAVNLAALIAHLHAWSAHYQRSRFGEKLGYFVFLTVVFANLAYIVLVRVPMVHADLNGSGFLFGGSVCKAVQVLEVALGAYQFIIACYYLAAVWRRTLYSSANPYDDFRYSRHGRDGVIVIFLATLTSFTLGLVLSFRFDEFKGPRLFDSELGAVSRESAMGALREAAHLRDATYCTSKWRRSLWLACIRWTVGFFGPLFLLAIPTGVQLARLRRRLAPSLRSHLLLSGLIIWSTTILNLPSIALQAKQTFFPHLGSGRGYRGPDQEYLDIAGAFVTYVLSGLLPELQLLCLPLGILLVLPNSCNTQNKPGKDFERRGEEPRLKNKTCSESVLLKRNGSAGKAHRTKWRSAIEVDQDNLEEEDDVRFQLDNLDKRVMYSRLSRSHTTVV